MALRSITPSERMLRAFSQRHQLAESRFGILVMPRSREERVMINPVTVLRTTVLTCFQAARHRDEGIGWTALWVLRSAGHVLHCQPKRGQPSQTTSLTPGSLVAFNADTDWHWTTEGKGLLAAASRDFGEEQPTDDQVRSAFDAAVEG